MRCRWSRADSGRHAHHHNDHTDPTHQPGRGDCSNGSGPGLPTTTPLAAIRHDDLAELVAAGWLAAPAPAEFGGLGLDLAAVAAEQRRMARYAPATALSTSMHLYWVGLAADLHRFGHPFGARILSWVADGEVLASGHAETGNDVPMALSTTRAERVQGGWRLHGRKLFGSLGPVWDRIGVHAMDATSPTGPVVVHGFIGRNAPGVTVVETWDAQGMRATESHDTVFDGAFVADERRPRASYRPGRPTDPAVGAMAVWALTLISNVYLGLAERAMELAIADAGQKTSIALAGGTLAHHPLRAAPGRRHAPRAGRRPRRPRSPRLRLGERGRPRAGLAHPGVHRQVAGRNRRPARGRPRVRGQRRCSFRRGGELERLSRDVAGARFHPGTDAFTHEAIGKALLGIDPAGPRW